MPSRTMRRATRKHKQRDENAVQKKRQMHPFLYAFSVVLLIVIAVTFIGGPAISGSVGGGRIVFGYYKDTPIEFFPDNYFSQRKDLIADQLRQTGEEEDLAAQAYQVWRTAFDQTVLHTAILTEAQSSGLWISEDRVNDTLIKQGPYTIDGTFSEERYNATPSVQRLAYKKLYREQLIHEQVLEDIFQGLRESPMEQQFVGQMVREQRRFSLVTFPFGNYPEQQVQSYAEENQERFRRIKLSRILIKSSEREAKEIRNKLVDRTGSFEELARAHSADVYAEKGGDMGWRYFYDLEADFEDSDAVETIFQLEETEISPVLESRFGWVIFRCDTPALEPDFDVQETRQVVRDYIMRYEKGLVEDYTLEIADSFRERVEDVGFLGATLEEDYTTGLTDYFPLNYQSFYFLSPVRSPLEQINLSSAAYSEEFFLQAFSLAPGEVSSPIVLDDQVVVLRLDDVREAPERELDLLDEFAAYYAQQSMEQDLQNVLLDPDYIQDDFDATFYEYVFPRQ
ncbi:MAG: peptidyl-prolyl cis-trans isomerase [Spirochaetales bacterium]|nr:peptidyl-prolyl cis-trans isomerase [Spirochaetales bacterium]